MTATEVQTISDRMILDGLHIEIVVWADDEAQCFYAICDEAPAGVRGKGKKISTAVTSLINEMEFCEKHGIRE